MGFSVVKEKGVAVLELNPVFYPEKVIDLAISKTKNLEIKKSMQGKKIRLELKAKEKVNLEELALEFSNYLLSTMKNSPL